MSTQTSLFAEAHRLEEKGEAFAIAFITEASGSVPRNSGRMLIRIDGSSVGTVGGGPMEAQVLEEAAEALREGRSRTVRRRLTPDGEGSAGMECGGTMEVRIDVTAAPPRLLLIGGGHVNLAIARTAAPLGFAVEVVESRPQFIGSERFPMARRFYRQDNLPDAIEESCPGENTWAVIATHDDDIRAVSALISRGCAYVGMLGSKRKVAVAVETLRKQKVPETAIAALRAPVGLDIGAQTPEEIAISVLGEILKIRSGCSGLPLQGMSKDLVVVRGGGDLATGTAWRLRRSGFQVLVLEVPEPTVIRRTVAFAEALPLGEVTVEGIRARKAESLEDCYAILESGDIPVLADAEGSSLKTLKPAVLVDAILAKRNLGTTRDIAPIVIALGPGFTAGEDCDAVVETARGHSLGRVILKGPALPNTGTPGTIAGKSAERVLRAPAEGRFEALRNLGDLVEEDELIATIVTGTDRTDGEIHAPFSGKLRGLLRNGIQVSRGFKVGDVDPRGTEVDESLISDKARAVAGGVMEALFHLRSEAQKGI